MRVGRGSEGKRSRRAAVTRALVHLGLAGLILGLAPGSAPTPEPIGFAENEATVRVGFLHWEADRYQHEWRKIWGFGRHLRADNISSALVDERAMIDALNRGVIAGAALDVFEVEPLPADSPLWDMPNVIVSPHNSGDYIGFHAVMARAFLQNFERFVSGEELVNVVNKSVGFVP